MALKIRLLPVLGVTALAVLGMKAAAIAESAGAFAARSAPVSGIAAMAADAATTAMPDLMPEAVDTTGETAQQDDGENGPADACPAPDLIADQAGLSPYEIQVLRSLSERRGEIDAREAALDTREQTIAAAEIRLSEQINELQTLESDIQSLIGELDEKNDAQLASLVKWYETMKPKDAARIFDTLNDSLLLTLADRMKPAAMAAILADMSSERARTLTQLMAQKTELPETAEALKARVDAG